MNFIYHLGSHLFRPSTILTNISYQPSTTTSPIALTPTISETSIITSPFDGNAINLNFFNLAKAITDLSYQSSIFQTWSNNAESTAIGFVNYNGRQELESTFYGGNPLTLTGATSFTMPYIMDGTAHKEFQMAAMNGIVYTNTGAISTSLSRFRPIIFGEIGDGSPFSTSTALTTYLNSKLKFNSNDGTNTFTILGNVNPITNWATTFGLISSIAPRSFYIFWNDGYTQYTNSLTTTDAITGFVTLNSTKAIVGQKATINYTLSTNTLTALQGYIQNVVNVAIGNGNTFSVAQSAGTFLQLNISNDRTQNGIFQVTLQKDPNDVGTGILEWLGWLNSVAQVHGTNPETLPANTSEAYDYTSIFQFVSAGVGPYTLNIVGAGAYSTFSFIDNYSSGTAFLSAFGLPAATTTYYNTRHPATTYTKTLNYGGPLWATSLNATNGATITGPLTVTGPINANAAFNPYGLPTYIPNAGFEFNTTNGAVPPAWLPYANAVPTASPTGAVTVYTFTVTFISNPGGTVLVNGVTVTIPVTLTTDAMIAQFLSTQLQAGYVFAYTGLNTFTISVSGPYANPTIVNGTLTSGMVSFGLSQVGGTPSNNVTLLVNNVSPLYGAYDAIITKDAANRQGQGYAIPFSLDRGATGQPNQLMFYYNTSLNYALGDLAVYIYDVQNASIIPASVSQVSSSPQASLFVATFFPSSSLNYRFLFHIASTSALAWTFEFDMLSVAPQSPYLTVMQAVTGTNSYTMPITSSGSAPIRGTGVVEYSGFKRTADEMEVVWTYSQTGIGFAGTGTYFWGLPPGLSIDLTKYPVGTTVGDAWLSNNTSLLYSLGSVQVASSTTLQINSINNTTNPWTLNTAYQPMGFNTTKIIAANIGVTNPAAWAVTGGNSFINFGIANISISFQARFCVAQWTTQINLASDFTEYVSNFDTSGTVNTTSFYSGKDGAGFPPVTTLKRVQFSRAIQITDRIEIEVYDRTVGQWFPIYSNAFGSLASYVQNAVVYGIYYQPVVGRQDQLDVAFGTYARPTGVTYGSAGESWAGYVGGIAGAANQICMWRIRKTSNGNSAEQLPLVRTEYQIQDAHALETPNGSIIILATKIEDTNSAYTQSPQRFTAPVAGVYRVDFFGEIGAVLVALNDSFVIDLYKNGVKFKKIASVKFPVADATANAIDLMGIGEVRLNTGDYIDVRITFKYGGGGTLKWGNTVSTVGANIVMNYPMPTETVTPSGTVTFLHLLTNTISTYSYASWATTTFTTVTLTSGVAVIAGDPEIGSIPRLSITRLGN